MSATAFDPAGYAPALELAAYSASDCANAFLDHGEKTDPVAWEAATLASAAHSLLLKAAQVASGGPCVGSEEDELQLLRAAVERVTGHDAGLDVDEYKAALRAMFAE